jgi:hypothetical protein
MAHSVCSVVKAPIGWLVLLDDVRLGGVYISKIEALNAAATAAAFVVKDGDGVQIIVPASPERGDPTELIAPQISPADTAGSVSSSAVSAANPHLRLIEGSGPAPGAKRAREIASERRGPVNPPSRLGFYFEWKP